MDEHISHHLLHAIHQGWRNPGDLAAIALAHLFEQCPVCREEFESWRRQVGEGVGRPEGGDFDAALDRICGADGAEDDELASEIARVESERQKARSRAGELLALPAEGQLDWIRTESRGHAGPLLAEALIEESRRKAPGYPWEAVTLANLARTVLQHADATLYAAELYTLALAHLANAIRVTGDLPRSDQVLSDARYFLRIQGGGDRLVRAELDSLEGSLRMGQRRPREAMRLLLRSQIVYRMEEELELTAGALLKLSRAHRELGEVDRALILIHEAEHHLACSPGYDRHLERCVLSSRILNLCRLGDGSGAEAFLVEQMQTGAPDPVHDLRDQWLQACILRSLGEMEKAKAALVSVREGFAELGLAYDACLAALEAAEVAQGLGLPHDAEHLAAEALPVFERLGVQVKVAEAKRVRDRAAAAARSPGR